MLLIFSKLKYLLRKVYSRCEIFTLWLLFLFRRKKEFYVSKIYVSDAVLICGNTTTIHWKSKGVYKINVNGVLSFPGNRTFIRLPLLSKDIHIRLEFIGINHRVTKELSLNAHSVAVNDSDFRYHPTIQSLEATANVSQYHIDHHLTEAKMLVNTKLKFNQDFRFKTKINQFNTNYFNKLYYGKFL